MVMPRLGTLEMFIITIVNVIIYYYDHHNNCLYPTVNNFIERDNKDVLYCIVLYCIALHSIVIIIIITVISACYSRKRS